MAELFLQTDNKKQYSINDLPNINPSWLTLGKIDIDDGEGINDDTVIKLKNPYVSPLDIMNYVTLIENSDILFSGGSITLGEFKRNWNS